MKGTFLVHALDDLAYGSEPFSPADPLYVAIHIATTLADDAAENDDTIATTDPVNVGMRLTIAPGTVNEETFEIDSIAGSGPYTVTLVGTLAHDHAQDDLVSFEPGPAGENLLEPSGDGYARVAIDNNLTTFNASASRVKSTAIQVTFADFTGNAGTATHIALLDDDPGGEMYEWFALATLVPLTVAANPVRLPAGNLSAEERTTNT